MPRSRVIDLDLGDVSKREELHERLASAFAFPAYYGKNWDAFWDCLTTCEIMPESICIRGWKAFGEALPREAVLMEKCLNDFRATPDGAAVVIRWV